MHSCPDTIPHFTDQSAHDIANACTYKGAHARKTNPYSSSNTFPNKVPDDLADPKSHSKSDLEPDPTADTQWCMHFRATWGLQMQSTPGRLEWRPNTSATLL